ncbi:MULTISPECIES: hypothetical protein [unclassified Exiguobacterium]|uniref:hypothetical protein n=1 Tax=unclassified Exiguobacterium TaxID=2644629 RepID=UPI001BEB614D|nr:MULTISPECIES: hypothetical protein [unclassified Exiguobacterium]
MRTYKYILSLGVICILTLGVYVVYSSSMEEPEFTVQTIQGNPDDQTVKQLQFKFNDPEAYRTNYKVNLMGKVKKKQSNYLSAFTMDYSGVSKAPHEFRQFMNQEEISKYEQEKNVFGLHVNEDGSWDLQSWKRGTEKMQTYSLPKPAKTKGIYYRPFQLTKQKLYVSRIGDIVQKPGTNHIYVIDLKKKTVQLMDLPFQLTEEDEVLAIYQNRVLYRKMTNDAKTRVYLRDNTTSTRLKFLEREEMWDIRLIDEGAVVGMTENMTDTKVKWSTYDLRTKQFKQHHYDLPKLVANEVQRYASTNIKNDLVYALIETKKNGTSIFVLDAQNEEVQYEGTVKYDMPKSDLQFNDMTIN